MKEITLEIDDFTLGESAYFYEISGDLNLSETEVEGIFRSVLLAGEAIETYDELPFFTNWVQLKEGNGWVAGMVFSRNFPPNFLKEEKREELTERKYSYLFFFKVGSKVALVKKNIKGLEAAIEDILIPLPHSVLSKALLKKESVFKRINMQNSDPHAQTYQNKTLVALDLGPLQSPVQNYKYAVRSASFSSEDRNFVVSFRSSKIQEGGAKVSVEELLHWVVLITEQFSSLYKGETILDTFANRSNFKRRPKDLEPRSINFLTGDLEMNINREAWEIKERLRGGKFTSASLDDIIAILNRNLRIKEKGEDEKYPVFSALNRPISEDSGLAIEFLRTKIKIHSQFLRRFVIFEQGSETGTLLQYYNKEQDFIVLFNHPEYAYMDGVLFQRNFVKKAHQVIAPVLIGNNDLKFCLSEKGQLTRGMSAFDSDSIFSFVEEKLAPQHNLKHLICDDYGNPEYADYIGIGERSINFYIAKGIVFKSGKTANSVLSASSMHDAIAQVEKNLFYITKGLNDWDKAKGKWGKKYAAHSKKGSSDIDRIRFSQGGASLIEQDFKAALRDTNRYLAFYVVVNFLSKKALIDQLIKLKDGKRANPQVYQLVWMIAQTISLCSEQGVKFFLVCQD